MSKNGRSAKLSQGFQVIVDSRQFKKERWWLVSDSTELMKLYPFYQHSSYQILSSMIKVGQNHEHTKLLTLRLSILMWIDQHAVLLNIPTNIQSSIQSSFTSILVISMNEYSHKFVFCLSFSWFIIFIRLRWVSKILLWLLKNNKIQSGHVKWAWKYLKWLRSMSLRSDL
jgi:hypothetical protein